MVKFDFTLKFEDGHGNEIERTVTAESKDDAIQTVANYLINRGTVSSQSEFSQKFQLVTTKYQFANAPWNNGEQLESILRDIDGVSSVRYDDPYDGFYEPPQYYLQISNGASESKVANRVLNYFNGFDVEQTGSKVIVKFANPQ